MLSFKSEEHFISYCNDVLKAFSKKYKKLKSWTAFNNFRFRTVTVIAYCYPNKTIGFNHIFVKLNYKLNVSALIDVLYHEIAHALDYEYNGNLSHGKTWKEWCKKIGAIPETRYRKNIFKKLNYKYAIVNKKTHHVYFTMKEIPDWCVNIDDISLFGRPETKGNLTLLNLY